MTGAAAVDFELALPHIGHAGYLSEVFYFRLEQGHTVGFICALLTVCSSLVNLCVTFCAGA